MSSAEELRRDVEAMIRCRHTLEAARDFTLVAEAVAEGITDTRITITLRPNGGGKVVVSAGDVSVRVIAEQADPPTGLLPVLDSLLGVLAPALAAAGRRREGEARDEWAARMEYEDDPA